MIRILHLSDPHFGAADAHVASAFLSRARDFAPDLTVLSGDLTMRARRSELGEARNFVAGLPRPRLIIPGNHDIPALNQPFQRFFAPFQRYRQFIQPNLQPTHSAPALHVVSVNSCAPYGFHADWSLGRISESDMKQLDKRLASAPPGCFRVLVLHHPLLAPSDYRRAVVHPLPALLELTEKHRVDLILCGHFHQSHLATISAKGSWATLVSQASTVCSTRLQGEPQGFHQIHHHEGQIDIDRYIYQDGKFDIHSHHTFHRGENGWTSEAASEIDIEGVETLQVTV